MLTLQNAQLTPKYDIHPGDYSESARNCPLVLTIQFELPDQQLVKLLMAESKAMASAPFDEAIETWLKDNVNLAKSARLTEDAARTAKEIQAADRQIARLSRDLEVALNDGLDCGAIELKIREAKAAQEVLRLRRATQLRLAGEARRLALEQVRTGLTALRNQQIGKLNVETAQANKQLTAAVEHVWPAFQTALGAAHILRERTFLEEYLGHAESAVATGPGPDEEAETAYDDADLFEPVG